MFRILIIAAALLIAAPAAAHQYSRGALSIVHPSSRPAAKGMTGVGYLTINNGGGRPDLLLAVESPVAAKVEIHASSNTGGVSRMSRLMSVSVPAKGHARLEPGAMHLMLIRLKRPLALGDKVPAVLVFRDAGRVPVEFVVQRGAGKETHVH